MLLITILLICGFIKSNAFLRQQPPSIRPTSFLASLDDHLRAEMEIIAQLHHGDQPAIASFKQHWFSQAGDRAYQDLLDADFSIGKGPDFWSSAEETLLRLIQQNDSFLEPRARLSKLYCLQGRFAEAKELSLQVLEVKPWHFVAMETMVAASIATGDDISLDLWKSRRLPVPSKKKERELWVDRALADAETILSRLGSEN